MSLFTGNMGAMLASPSEKITINTGFSHMGFLQLPTFSPNAWQWSLPLCICGGSWCIVTSTIGWLAALSPSVLQSHLASILLSRLGLCINVTKSILVPTQTLQFSMPESVPAPRQTLNPVGACLGIPSSPTSVCSYHSEASWPLAATTFVVPFMRLCFHPC